MTINDEFHICRIAARWVTGLVPGLEDEFMKDGGVSEKLTKKGSVDRYESVRLHSPDMKPLYIKTPVKPDAIWHWDYGTAHPPAAHMTRIPQGAARHEDFMHDWVWRGGQVKYHGIGIHSPNPFWIILQYGAEHAPELTKKCPGCGTDMPESSAFCPNCGAKQTKTASAASTVIWTVISIRDGDDFDARTFHYIKTQHGWHKVKGFNEISGQFIGRITPESVVDSFVDKANAEHRVGLRVPGIKNGKIEHPIHMEALPVGSVITSKAYGESVRGPSGWDGNLESEHFGGAMRISPYQVVRLASLRGEEQLRDDR